MGILQVQNIDLSFGDRTLLSNVSLTLGEHARAALAGGNGEGKSTLMKIIAGIASCDSGSITKTRGMRVSYLPQSDIVLKDNTVYEEMEKGFGRFAENLRRQHEIEHLLLTSHTDALLNELSELQESLLASSYYDRERTISEIAKGLGLTQKDLNRPCSEFSGGYQMRIALARVLCESPDLMMLDEPTNYLDIEARLWLENFLKSYGGSVFLVCHDKGFLDDTVNEVYELFNSKLTRYSGNYTFYENQRRLEIEQLEAAYRKQQAEIERTEQFIERFRYKATKSRQVQSRIKMLDKLEPVVVPSHLKTLRFTFPEPPHSPNDMVVIEHMTKKYGSQVVFDDFSMIVNKGQRLAVTGHNGIGKSTLLRIIAGQDAAIDGTARLGTGVKTGYYAQDTADSLDMNGTVFDQVSSYGTEGAIRNALRSFLFSGDDIYKKASVLSGGERSRLALLKILLQPASLLILDEPTNHLDIASREWMEDALSDYEQTLVFVSHDRYFIDKFATRILFFNEDGTVTDYRGGYRDFSAWRERQQLFAEAERAKEAKEKKPVRRVERTADASKSSAKIEREIEKLEAQIARLNEEAETAASDYLRLMELDAIRQELEEKLIPLYERWEELNA